MYRTIYFIAGNAENEGHDLTCTESPDTKFQCYNLADFHRLSFAVCLDSCKICGINIP